MFVIFFLATVSNVAGESLRTKDHIQLSKYLHTFSLTCLVVRNSKSVAFLKFRRILTYAGRMEIIDMPKWIVKSQKSQVYYIHKYKAESWASCTSPVFLKLLRA